MTRKLRKFLGASCVTTAAMPVVNCPESIKVVDRKLEVISDHALELAHPVSRVVQAISEQKRLRSLLDLEADARRGKLLIKISQRAFQQRDDVLLVEPVEDRYLVDPVDEGGAQQVIDLFQHDKILARRLLIDLLVADEADVPAGQLIGLLLRQVAGQDDESVAEREHASQRAEDATVNRRRQGIAE